MRPKSACHKHVQQARHKGHKELNTQSPCHKHAASMQQARQKHATQATRSSTLKTKTWLSPCASCVMRHVLRSLEVGHAWKLANKSSSRRALFIDIEMFSIGFPFRADACQSNLLFGNQIGIKLLNNNLRCCCFPCL